MDKKSDKSSLIIIFLTVFIDLVGFGIIIPLSPFLARQFSASPLEIGILMSIFSLMQFLFSPFWGRLSDKYGRRPIILMSLVGAGLSYVGFAFSNSFLLLVIMRGFAGTFSATISTANAYIADVTEGKDRAKGMGMIGAAFGLGFICGPLLGAGLAIVGKQLGAEPPFGQSFASLGAALLCFLNFGFAYVKLKEPRRKSEIEKSAKEKRFKLILNHFKRPMLGALMFTFFLASLSMALMEVMLFPYVEDRFEWGIEKASLGFAYIGVVMAFVQGYLIRKLLNKTSEKALLNIGLILMGLSLAAIPLCPNIWWLAVVMTGLAVGNGLMRPALMGLISLNASDHEQGEVLGVSHSLSALGRIIGPVIGGWMYQSVSMGSPFVGSGILSILGFIVVLILAQKSDSEDLVTAKK